ncbi:uncharacterized protein LOC125767314 [Anopheles funestus]|uniref:uncharacterized protein LOC125767314 n=1 Tax=Anopheles funestus TaxID=62324 RepID=UPI0020C6ECD5|nr:uncharacterized protein LOC125767314 [Anopheles funestus]
MELKRKATPGKSPTVNPNLHGSAYHINLTIVILLRAYELHTKNQSFSFLITVEDAEGGKFDDIIYRRYLPDKCKEVVYIQAKHERAPQEPDSKKPKLPVSLDNLLKKYHLGKHFLSFIEICNQHANGDETHKYVLCTNTKLDTGYNSEKYLKELTNMDILSFATDIHAKSYKLNMVPELEAMLLDDSIDLFGKLFKQYIFPTKESYEQAKQSKQDNGKGNNPVLFEIFSDLIGQCVELLDDHNNDVGIRRCRFKDEFHKANGSTLINEFKMAFNKHSSKQLKECVAQNAEMFLDVNCLVKPHQNEGNTFGAKIKQFCDSFVLVVDSLNEEQLHEYAKKQIPCDVDVGLALDRFQHLVFDAMKNSSGVPVLMDPEFVKNTLEELECHKHFNHQIGRTDKYLTELRMKYPFIVIKSDCWDRYDHLNSLYNFITSDCSGIYQFSSSYDVDMSALIVSQMPKCPGRECLFINSAEYQQNPEMGRIVNLILARHKYAEERTVKILIAIGELANNARDCLRNFSEKYGWKIITVERHSESLIGPQTERFLKVSDLTVEARKDMRKHNNLQIFGTDVSFDTIVYENDDLTHLLPLLEEAEKSENFNKNNFTKISSWYIHRDFACYEMQDECLQTLCASSKVVESLKKKYFNVKATFEELIDEFANLNDDDLSFAAIGQTVESEPPGFDNGCKVNIVINDAGFGKSAYFTWLAWRLPEIQPSLYVVKLNALEYSTDFERLDKHKIEEYDGTEVIRLLYHFVYLALFVSDVNRQTVAETDIIRDQGDQCAKLLRISDGQVMLDDDPSNRHDVSTKQLIALRLFREKLNQKQFVLLLDGFDEVAAYYKETVLACLKLFSELKQIKCIYISSRPYDFEEDFRRTFTSCTMYRLKRFSRREQIMSLNKFLILEFKDKYEQCELHHRHLVLRVLYAILDNVLDDVKTVPLLLGMAFTKILPSIKQHIDFESKTLCGTIYKQEKLNTLQLVENFVEKKLAIANTVKTGSTDSAAKTAGAIQQNKLVNKAIQELHAVLAMHVMFASGYREKLLSKKEKKQAKQCIDNMAEINTGLVNGIRDNIPLFVHSIFAEYLAACWLHEHDDLVWQEQCFRSKFFWAYGLKRMRTFFDQMIIRESGGSDIHMAVLNDSAEQVQTLLSNNRTLAVKRDKYNRTPLHLAVRKLCNRAEIRNAILKEMSLEDVNQQDKLFGWTALDYAFVTGNDNAIKELIRLGANINIKALVQQLCSNELNETLKLTQHYCELLKEWEEHKATAEIVYHRTVSKLIKKTRLNIYACQERLGSHSVLSYCVRYKMYDIFRQLVEQTGKCQEVLADTADRLIQIAFEVQAHEITNYLIADCGFRIPWIKCSRSLVYALKALISLKCEVSFKKILTQLCIQRTIACVDDDAIVNEMPVISDANEPLLYREIHPKVCCVHSNANVHLPLQEYDGYDYVNDACVFELLITRAVHEGNLQLTSYIIQKKGMIITSSLIVAIMRLLPKLRGVRHERSIPCFSYLLDRTIDLDSTDSKGRNLLHMVAQNGCFYMMHCLIMKGFDRAKINGKNNWNTIHYVAGSVQERNEHPVKTYQYLMYQQDNSYLHTPDTNGYRVLELSVQNYHFKLTKTIFEDMFGAASVEQKVSELMICFEKIIQHSPDIKPIKHFLRFVSHDQGHFWGEIYKIIRNKIFIL